MKLICLLSLVGPAWSISSRPTYLTDEDFANAATMEVKAPTALDRKARENGDLLGGDIAGISMADGAGFRNAYNVENYPERIWPGGVIPYRLPSAMTSEERAVVASAFAEIQEETCLRFHPKTSKDKDFVDFKRNENQGCNSHVGRRGGGQPLQLQVNNGHGHCYTKGTVIHELLHAVGFFHEQERPDRDTYIRAYPENVEAGKESNFEKYSTYMVDTLGMPYDFRSVMHYDRYAFSKNGKPTLEAKKDPNMSLGNDFNLSDIDAKKIRKLYKCPEKTAGGGDGGKDDGDDEAERKRKEEEERKRREEEERKRREEERRRREKANCKSSVSPDPCSWSVFEDAEAGLCAYMAKAIPNFLAQCCRSPGLYFKCKASCAMCGVLNVAQFCQQR